MATSGGGCRAPRNSDMRASTRHSAVPTPSLTHISWRLQRRVVSPSPTGMLNRSVATSTPPSAAVRRNDSTGCTTSRASTSNPFLRFVNHTTSSPHLSRDGGPATVITALPCPAPCQDHAALLDVKQGHDTSELYTQKNQESTSSIAFYHHSEITESLRSNRPRLSRMSQDNVMGQFLNIHILHPPCPLRSLCAP